MGSDWSVSTPDPMAEMEVAVTRIADYHRGERPAFLPDERIGLMDALAAFTMGSAYVNHQDHDTGSIEVGKAADLAVFDRDLFDRSAGAIGGDALCRDVRRRRVGIRGRGPRRLAAGRAFQPDGRSPGTSISPSVAPSRSNARHVASGTTVTLRASGNAPSRRVPDGDQDASRAQGRLAPDRDRELLEAPTRLQDRTIVIRLERAEHRREDRTRQPWHVTPDDECHVGCHGFQARDDADQRPALGDPVVGDPDPAGQLRRRVDGGDHDHDIRRHGPDRIDRPRQDRAVTQWLGELVTPVPARTTTREDDRADGHRDGRGSEVGQPPRAGAATASLSPSMDGK